MKNKIVQHPSTPDYIKDPTYLAESCLSESMPILIEIMDSHGFDVRTDTFKQDFRLVVEMLRAMMHGQLGVHHDLNVGLGENNPLNILDDKE